VEEAPPAIWPPPPERKPQPPIEPSVEAELAKWNWGAFWLTWIWGLGNSVARSFLVFVPFYGLYEWFLLGKNGNRWAWETKRWRTIEEFHASQRKWAIAGWIVLALGVLIVIASLSSSGSSG
jgi:hypothetical protein